MTEVATTMKICPKCGASFSCTPHDCWCSKLPPALPVDMNAECYCPQCLTTIIAEKEKTKSRI